MENKYFLTNYFRWVEIKAMLIKINLGEKYFSYIGVIPN